MCEVSNKLKLCTCKTTSAEKLKHYWIFHRYDKEKNNHILGICIMPYMLDEKVEIKNKASLLIRLNEADAFDVDLAPKNRDRLQLTFTCPGTDNEQVTYGYSYKKGKWLEEEYDPLEWRWNHYEEEFGKIIHALDR